MLKRLMVADRIVTERPARIPRGGREHFGLLSFFDVERGLDGQGKMVNMNLQYARYLT